MRAQARAPLWNDSRSYFSLGEWMLSSSSANPTSRLSMPSSRLKEPTIGMDAPQPTRAVADEFGFHVRGQAGGHERPERLDDPFGALLPDQPERDLGAGPRGQHGFRALARVAPDDAVDVAGRTRPQLLERRSVALARRRRQADVP